MSHSVDKIAKWLVAVMFVIGMVLIFKGKVERTQVLSIESSSAKSLILKKYLLKYQKPARIEIAGLSTKFVSEIDEIKKLKVAQDSASDFYVIIKLFSDETDAAAPLVAQIQFIDLKSGNLRKEESINLD